MKTFNQRFSPLALVIGVAVLAGGLSLAPAAASGASARETHLQAIEHALKGDTILALAVLKPLASAPMSADEHDRVLLTLARVQYQAGDDAAAIEAYSQIRKGGPAWLEALEERASAYMRLGRPQDALASLKTVLTPMFKDKILSEPYYLAALAQLRVCDFKAVFKTLALFKERFRDRVKEWDAAKADPVAQSRLVETRETIQKLNLLEAEAIQRLYIDESGKRLPGSPPKIVKGSDQLSFPMDPETDSKEVWVDEVDDYRVSVKGCPTAGPAPSPETSSAPPPAAPAALVAKKEKAK